jgi:hypothetical protein
MTSPSCTEPPFWGSASLALRSILDLPMVRVTSPTTCEAMATELRQKANMPKTMATAPPLSRRAAERSGLKIA